MGNKDIFIPRKFRDLENGREVSFDEIIQSKDNFISVILGEPASGKTYQLERYEETHKNSKLLQLKILLDYRGQDINSYNVFLLDSIDEALFKGIDSDKLLLRLENFIKDYKDKTFIITCRFLEWKSFFEKRLREIDKKVKVYEILPFEREEINSLLIEQDKGEFWNFVEKNHLVFLVTKNIVITKYLTQNFNNKYKGQDRSVSYTDVYRDIIEENIKAKGERREDTKKVKKLFPIVASLASYMMLNREDVITKEDINDLENFVDSLYQIDGKDIKGKHLSLLLATNLFNNFEGGRAFLHKSIQEYLMAYFINYKKLDFETIKEIFAHKLRFYEEFEEVIIFLTNIEPKYFEDIVNFDPFIFRRHPSLNEIEQRQLLVSVLHKVQHEEWMINSTKSDLGKWGTSRWRLLNGSTIFKYGELSEEDLYNLVIENIKEAISLSTFTFLIKLIEFNKNKNLEDYILKYLEKIPFEKQREYITNGFELTGTFVSEGSFNLNLVNDIFTENFLNHYVEKKTRKRLDRFISNLIRLLYIQKDKCTNINFEIIFKLLVNIQNHYSLSNVIPLFEVQDSKKWLDLTLRVYKEYRYSDLYRCHPNWLIYSLLKNKIDLREILSFLDKHPWIERPFKDPRMLLN